MTKPVLLQNGLQFTCSVVSYNFYYLINLIAPNHSLLSPETPVYLIAILANFHLMCCKLLPL